MERNQKPRVRRLNRLRDYDYSQPGGYFITICTKNRSCLFGVVDNDRVILNQYGEIIRISWLALPEHYHNIELDVFVIMPNHIHSIIFLTDVGAGLKPAPTRLRFKKDGAILPGRFPATPTVSVHLASAHIPGPRPPIIFGIAATS